MRLLRSTVPAEVPGIFFLSGGQTPEEATAHLDAMNRVDGRPWVLSFSYGRALQEPPLAAWKDRRPTYAPLEALLLRARLNSAACCGQYDAAMERTA